MLSEAERAGGDAKTRAFPPASGGRAARRRAPRARRLLKPTFEVRDEQDRAVARSEPEETTVLLGGGELSESLSLKAALPPGKYRLVYRVDFGESQTVQAGQYDFEVATPVAEKKPAP